MVAYKRYKWTSKRLGKEMGRRSLTLQSITEKELARLIQSVEG